MERLTELVNGELMYSCRGQHFNSYGEFQYAVLNKLAQYENTGLTPQEVEELKQKQTPKKIYHEEWVGIDGVPYDLCTNCKTNLCTNGFMPSKKEKYCANCGQKLDWSVIDEM